jgi:hypothetical protein
MNKLIDFTGINAAKVLFNGTKQWDILHKMNESEWKTYTATMAGKKVLVEYDTQINAYIAKPIKESSMPNNKMPVKTGNGKPQYLLQDEDMDMESDAIDLINSIDLEDEPEVEIEAEPEVAPKAPAAAPPVAKPVQSTPTSATSETSKGTDSINLSQFEALLNKILGGSKGELEVPAEKPETQDVEPGSFLGNPLESEFDVNSDSISFLDSKKADTYQASIDSTYSQKKSTSPSAPAEDSPAEDLNEEDELNEWGQSEYNDYDREINKPKKEDSELNEYENSEMEYHGENTGKLTEDGSEDDFPAEETEEDSDDAYGYEGDDDSSFPSEDDEIDEVEPEEEAEPITQSGIAKIGGQPVQIILTGVMITPSEVNYVAEATKRAGMRLKTVQGEGKVVNFIVENAGKQYTIKYEDMPSNKTKTPFSIKHYTFTTLDEALKRINYSKTQQINEAKNFKRLIGSDIAERSITDINESTILKEFEGKISKDYVAGWNVKAVGSINLKNGLNETYSNITEHSEEANVLVKTKDGQFFMLKGNLKERSEVGTKRQLVDLDGKRDFGVGIVVGIYENTLKGLGQVMFKVKKTTLPLLTWK